MATITRGYSFATYEWVTNTKLHKLIDDATISGLAAADFGGDIHGLASASPVSATEGDAWVSPDTLSADDGSFYENNYCLATKFGAVTLFSPHGMETRRVHAGTDSAVYAKGAACECETNGGGTTLAAFAQKITSGNWALDIIGGLGRATLAQKQTGRLAIIGPCPVKTETNYAAGTWPLALRRTLALQQWGCTSASNTDCVHGMRISDHSAAGVNLCMGYLFGGPLWRGT
jgi:hypothetical protein